MNNRRIVVDVERGRTAKGWRPMRLGGGLGGRKAKKSKKEIEAELEAKKLEDARTFAEAATTGVSAPPDARGALRPPQTGQRASGVA